MTNKRKGRLKKTRTKEKDWNFHSKHAHFLLSLFFFYSFILFSTIRNFKVDFKGDFEKKGKRGNFKKMVENKRKEKRKRNSKSKDKRSQMTVFMLFSLISSRLKTVDFTSNKWKWLESFCWLLILIGAKTIEWRYEKVSYFSFKFIHKKMMGIFECILIW